MGLRPLLRLTIGLLAILATVMATTTSFATSSAAAQSEETTTILVRAVQCTDETCAGIEASLDGVVISAVDVHSDEVVGTCTTSFLQDFGACEMEIPAESTFTLIWDETTVPSEVVPIDGPIVEEEPLDFSLGFFYPGESLPSPFEEGPTPDGWNRELFSTLCAEPPPGAGPVYAPYEGCEAAAGVTMIVTDEAGATTFGTCITTSPSSAEGAASCFVVIPYSTAAVISQDPATLPEEYVPLTETQIFQAPAGDGPVGALERNLFVNVPAQPAEPTAAPIEPTVPEDEGDPPLVFESGGIGLTRADWEAVYGEGTPVDDLFEYPTPDMAPCSTALVRYEEDLVAHIETGCAEGAQLGGISVEDAEDRVAGALPADAELVETFSLPATPDGPTALRVQRWESASLAERTGGRASILVVYQEETAQQNPDSPPTTVVPRFTLTMPDAD